MNSDNTKDARESDAKRESPSTALQPMQHDPTAPPESDQGGIPHAMMSALQVSEGVKAAVKEAVKEAVAWADAKVNKLAEKDEDGDGPYQSPATCAPSDFDVIAAGVIPAMPSQEAQEAALKDSKQEGLERCDRDESEE